MENVIGILATLGVAYIINRILFKLGFTPEKNSYFGDDYNEEA